jgi:hypothetical protein
LSLRPWSFRLRILALSVGLLAAVVSRAAAAHPHYEHLLREGTFALERGDAAEAARELRLACFGYLEEPRNLADCLVRLALAQAAAGDDEGFRGSFRRLAEVEDRFHAYSRADIPSERKQAFETEVASRIPPRILSETPGLGHLVPPSGSEGAEVGEGGEPTGAVTPGA